MSARNRVLLFSVFGSLLCLGCRPGPPTVKTVPVTGTVTYQGKPVAGADVIFMSGTGSVQTGELALAKTDDAGKFVLKCYLDPVTQVDGAIPGTFKVSISKKVPPPGYTAEQYAAKVEAARKYSEDGKILPENMTPPPQVEMLPAKYSNLGESQLEQIVKPDGPNVIAFDLK